MYLDIVVILKCDVLQVRAHFSGKIPGTVRGEGFNHPVDVVYFRWEVKIDGVLQILEEVVKLLNFLFIF